MHKLLEIQLRKSFGNEWRSAVDSPELTKLLSLVEQGYIQHDEDYHLLEHVLQVSSDELTVANKEILKNHELLHSVTESINDIIFYKGLDFRYIGCNKHFLKLLGKSTEEIIGQEDFELFEPQYAKLFREMDEIVLKTSAPNVNKEWVKYPDGHSVLLLTTKAPLVNARGELFGLVGVARDITKEYELEQEIKSQQAVMIQQSRLAALGEMIGNIAHQWRQPLNTLGLIVQDTQEAYDFGELDEKYIKTMSSKAMEQINYMSRTIDDFRNFFAPNKEKKLFSLRESILEPVEMLTSEMKKRKIEWKISIPEELNVYGMKNEFSQVIFNVVKNAKDALIGNGIASPFIGISAQSRAGNKCEITIEDNAGGISAANIDRIFEPYFTTKEEGNGTGIGLYMSKIIVEEHMHGKLSVKNRAAGAVFSIILKTTIPKNEETIHAV